MNHIFRDPKPGQHCWCDCPHAPYTGQHRHDTSDPEWPSGQPSCLCGGGAWGVPHHA